MFLNFFDEYQSIKKSNAYLMDDENNCPEILVMNSWDFIKIMKIFVTNYSGN